jgi:hypothetical protein
MQNIVLLGKISLQYHGALDFRPSEFTVNKLIVDDLVTGVVDHWSSQSINFLAKQVKYLRG